MFFFTSGAEARTHHAACVLAALADSDATQCSVREAAMVFGKLEMSLRLPRFVICAQTQIFVQPIRFDYFARIHLPIRIPQGFELTERLNQFGAEHFWQQFRARLS